MSERTPLANKSAKLKKAVLWMGETLRDHPEKERQAVVREAEFRFDLTPSESEFLDQHFVTVDTGTTST